MQEYDQNDPTIRSQEFENDEELASMVAHLRIEEGRRQKRMMLIFLMAFSAIAVGVWAIVTYRQTIFSLPIPIEQGEQDILEQTNDPVCRKMIADITAVAATYFDTEPQIEQSFVGDELDLIKPVLQSITGMQERLKTIEKDSEGAVLRYENSRSELNTWLSFVQNELRVLVRLGQEKLELLEDDESDRRTIDRELLSRALMTTHESFQNFRVWHTAAFHPCGQAPDGVEPWIASD